MQQTSRHKRITWSLVQKEWTSAQPSLTTIKKAQTRATKKPVGLSRTDGKRLDGATLIPWTRGKLFARNITVYAQFRIRETVENAEAAAMKAAIIKTTKCACLTTTHHFVPIAIKTGESWNTEAAEFFADLGRRITQVTLKPLETQYLFQRISITLQRGNEIAF